MPSQVKVPSIPKSSLAVEPKSGDCNRYLGVEGFHCQCEVTQSRPIYCLQLECLYVYVQYVTKEPIYIQFFLSHVTLW